MCTIKEMRQRLNSLRIEAISIKAFNDNKNEAADALRYQWQDGQGGAGQFPDYSPNSVLKYGKRPGPWTLHDTGSLASKIYFVAKKNGVESFSRDRKADIIQEKLGGVFAPMGIDRDLKPFSLNADSKKTIKPFIFDSAIKQIKEILKL